MSPVVHKLIGKELYVHRWLLIGASVSVVVSASIASWSAMAFNIGALTWITTVIALGVMLGIYGIMNERKEHSLEFVLSLPLSAREYVASKVIGLMLCFVAPWLVATASAIALVLGTAVPDGLLPYVVLLCVFTLSNFSVVLCGALHARSEAATTAIILVTNMAVSLFMFIVGGLPSLNAHMSGAVPVWNRTFFLVLGIELIVLAIAVTLPFLVAARRRDYL